MKKNIALFISFVLLSSAFGVASARSPFDTTPNEKSATVAQGRAVTITPKAVRTADALSLGQCEQVRERIQKRAEHFLQNQERHQKNYLHATAQMEALILVLQERGYDTSTVEAEIAVMDTKFQKLMTDLEAANAVLTNLAQTDCETKEQYRNGLKEAQAALRLVQADVRELMSHYRNNVRKSILALKTAQVTTDEPEVE